MSKEKTRLRDELNDYKLEFGLKEKRLCSTEENKRYQNLIKNGEKLPDGVYTEIDADGEISTNSFYTMVDTDLTDDEIKEYIALKQLKLIKTIKNCVLFFTILTLIGLGGVLILSAL